MALDPSGLLLLISGLRPLKGRQGVGQQVSVMEKIDLQGADHLAGLQVQTGRASVQGARILPARVLSRDQVVHLGQREAVLEYLKRLRQFRREKARERKPSKLKNLFLPGKKKNRKWRKNSSRPKKR